MPNKLEEAFDNILGVGTAEAATTPEAKKFIRKQEGKKQIGKSGKVISNAGIEQATYDELVKKYKLPKKNVSDLSESEINNVYDKYFEDVPYEKLPSKTAISMSDYAFHQGKTQANKELQREVGTKDDSIIGDKTLSKVNNYTSSKSDKGLADALIKRRKDYQKTKSNYNKNKSGWNNRLDNLRKEIGE
jgi:lysozyme family protein